MATKAEKLNQEYPEIRDIRKDLDLLKNDAVALTRHIKEAGQVKTEQLKNNAMENWDELQEYGQKNLQKVERHVKAKPMQSLAIAFATGIIASYLLRRR